MKSLLTIMLIVLLATAINAAPKYCCNTCKPVKVKIETVYKTKVFTINVPYPVFKPLTTSALTKCPPKFKKVSKRKCVHYVKSKTTCPPGYFRVSDDSCIKVVVLPPTHPEFKVKCPKGYKSFGELGCKIGKGHKSKFPKLPEIVKKVWNKELVKIGLPTPKESLKCPVGYIQKGKYHCVKTLKCPKGYRKNKAGYCIRQKVKCPKGYTRLGKQCIKSMTVCPRGYKYNKKNHYCSKHFHKIYKNKCTTVKCAKPTCKSGFKPVQKPGKCCQSCQKCRCSKRFNPVCASNGITYKNKCTAECLNASHIREGACSAKCGTNKCPYYYRPVCSNGVTYTNRCLANNDEASNIKNGSCTKVKCPEKKK